MAVIFFVSALLLTMKRQAREGLAREKEITREDKQKMRSDGAYWRRVEDFADQIKGNIDTERQYTRLLRDCAMAGAFAYDKSFDRAKGDIEERFTRRYLYNPAEYYQVRLETGDRDQPQSADKQPDRTGRQEHKSRSGKNREADEGALYVRLQSA